MDEKKIGREGSYWTGEVEKSYKIFANPVFITPGKSDLMCPFRQPNVFVSDTLAANQLPSGM